MSKDAYEPEHFKHFIMVVITSFITIGGVLGLNEHHPDVIKFFTKNDNPELGFISLFGFLLGIGMIFTHSIGIRYKNNKGIKNNFFFWGWIWIIHAFLFLVIAKGGI